MAELKASLDQLFKNGKDFEFNMGDYSTKKSEREMTRLEVKYKELDKSSCVDFNDPIMRTPFVI